VKYFPKDIIPYDIHFLARNSLPNAVFAASSAKNFKMNLFKVNLDRFLTIVE